MVIVRGWGGGNGELVFKAEFQFGRWKKFWKWMVVMVVQQCEYNNATDLYI